MAMVLRPVVGHEMTSAGMMVRLECGHVTFRTYLNPMDIPARLLCHDCGAAIERRKSKAELA